MKLSEWAEREGIHYQTAWRWFSEGKMPVPAYKAQLGAILVDLPEETTGQIPGWFSTHGLVASQRTRTQSRVAGQLGRTTSGSDHCLRADQSIELLPIEHAKGNASLPQGRSILVRLLCHLGSIVIADMGV